MPHLTIHRRRPGLAAVAALSMALAGLASPASAEGILFSQAVLAHSGAELVPQAMAANSFEIESSRLALRRAHDPRVRRLASRLLRDHLSMQRQLIAAARRDGYAPVAGPLDGASQDRLATLGAASDASFDATFVVVQVEAHVDSINLFSSYSTRGLDPALLRLTARTLPALHAHYTQAERLRERGVA